MSSSGNGPDFGTLPEGDFPPLPTGSALYSGTLNKTVTSTASDAVATYTEVQVISGLISLNANFDTGTLTASVSNPRSDFSRSSTQSSAPNYNFSEEAAYVGTVSGTGTVTGTSFASTLAGNLTQTSLDRIPVTGALPAPFTGSLSGRVSGTNYATATGTVTLGATVSGQTTPLFTDQSFSASRQ